MKQNHIIHKVLVELTVEDQRQAHLVKDDISSFLSIDVFPKLEKYINTLEAKFPKQTLQIEQLKLDISGNPNVLDSELKKSVVSAFKKALTEAVKPFTDSNFDLMNDNTDDYEGISLLEEPEKLLRAFIYFLEKGEVPWWNSNQNAFNILDEEVFEKIFSVKGFESSIAAVLLRPNVPERIVNQLTDSQIKRLSLAVFKNNRSVIDLGSQLMKQPSKSGITVRTALWSLVLNIAGNYLNRPSGNHEEYAKEKIIHTLSALKTSGTNPPEEIAERILDMFPFISTQQRNEIKAVSLNDFTSETDADKNLDNIFGEHNKKNLFFEDNAGNQIDNVSMDEEGIHIQNAGLILIHPFIMHLFSHCGLIDPKTKELTNPALCVHLLHYIATGKINQPESNMLFEKFLCNVPLQRSISRHVKLSQKHKNHAKKVTDAVRENWSAMSNASLELLQTEFFQRPGKLVLKDNPTLTVERKTQDILLDKLSWGLGLVKLSWHETFIYVNW
ncbi:MAG: contractile injection system tape measure protein [Flavobacterium sp.]|nr:contractile injection system tape measure protein [Flavobacterium sp.]